MTLGFTEILKTMSQDGGVQIPDSWKQGRTAYGGLTAALCVAAARRDQADLPALRSLQMNFTGPVMGDPVFETKLLRQGRNVSSVGVSGLVEGGHVADAQCIFGADRQSSLDVDFPMPEVSAPDDTPAFFPPGAEKFAPAFIQNFEVKLAGGHAPMSGADEGHVLCWARHKDEAARDTEAGFLCLGDVLPPAAYSMMRAPVPISSVNWTLNLLRAPVSLDGWFLIDSRQSAARQGYSSQMMRFWNTDGQLVAEGMQIVAVFG